MHLIEIRIDNFRLFGTDTQALVLPIRPGLNVLAGENDAGKTAVIDAIRLTLGTTSQEFLRISEEDFHLSGDTRATDFTIRCRFADIDEGVGGSLLEHLSYESGQPCLYVTFRATRNEALSARRRFSVEVRSGPDGNGPKLEGEARVLLQATYLRPLRDAERELAAGRNSRLSQILQHTKEIAEHKDEVFEPASFVRAVTEKEETEFPKSVANVSRLADHLIQENEGITKARGRLDRTCLAELSLGDEQLGSRVSVTDIASADQRLRTVLEKLELRLAASGDPRGQLPHGLGYNNLLFMACELLLLGQDRDTLPLLLIEEPEAHLHPQLQLRLMEFLQEEAASAVGRQVQVIITTHSPNLASKAKLASMILLFQGQAFPLAPEYTLLSKPDYRFLERFLDVTKANLFFARGVVIVEGDSEALLLPSLACLVRRDLTRYGVSIVNVGSRGLRRYARIFQRRSMADGSIAPVIPIHVACLADRDIMPDCATEAFGLKDHGDDSEGKKREPKFESDLADEAARQSLIEDKRRGDGENVKTFVSDHWTLEYDLAHAGLGCLLSQAVALAKDEVRQDRKNDDQTTVSPKDDAGEDKKRVEDAGSSREKVLRKATKAWEQLEHEHQDRSDKAEFLSCKAYESLRKSVSKPMAAQHLASLLEESYDQKGTEEARERLRKCVPSYIQKAIEYVTCANISNRTPESSGETRVEELEE